jgi:hypothetical protein
MQKILSYGGTAILCLVLTISRAQTIDTSSTAGKALSFPGRLLARIQKKTTDLNNRLTAQTQSYLQKMANQEAKMQRRMNKVDSAGAQSLFSGSVARYAALQQRIKTDTGHAGQPMTGAYPAYLDSMQGSVAFLKHNPQLASANSASQLSQLQGTGSQLQALQAKMGVADEAKAYMQSRKQQIADYLSQHTGMRGLLASPLNSMNQTIYYYGQQLRGYEEMWTSPDRLEAQALTYLNKFPAFQTFMKSNSMLGGLFNLPGNYATPQAINGLQTKDQVSAIVQQQVGGQNQNGAMGVVNNANSAGGSGGGGGAGMDAFQSNLGAAQSQLDTYKSKLSALGAGNGDLDMPDFKPNDQKTKTFWKRLQYGTDFQTSRNNYYFPTVTDFGLSVAYKLGHNNLIGIGASYKLGWGNGIQHIAFSNEGVGLRSFLQIKIKGTFSLTGGFEYNYTTPFTSYQQIKQLQYWTKSGLIGVTKTVGVKNRFFKQTSLSLLWDFLSYQQIPQTQPFVFRIGYTF